MVLQSIFLNSENVEYNGDNITYNKLRFKFQTPVEFKNNAKISLGSLNLYYSWFNISKSYNNNSFSYIFRGQSRTFTLTDVLTGQMAPSQLLYQRLFTLLITQTSKYRI